MLNYILLLNSDNFISEFPQRQTPKKMSSYQFVNTLAQCYAAEQSGQAATSQNTQDYYNMNYPNCYSPNLAATSHAAAATVSQYGSANPYSLMIGNSNNGQNSGDFSSQQQQQQQQTGQRGSANQSPITTSTNCKYADSVQGGANRITSPQDLSKEGESNVLNALAAAAAANDPKTSPDTPTSSQQQQLQHQLSPLRNNNGSPVSSSKSPNEDANSTTDRDEFDSPEQVSANEGGRKGRGSSKQNNEGDGKNPPQIYPWMKRVHLGQSKLNKTLQS